MHDGKIIEQGTHDQLMAFGGHYAELFSLQASSYLTDSVVDTTSKQGRT
jgi:ABC-type transport system involved in cytochrome bd biosynthesis fused ATPase/permease subunit